MQLSQAESLDDIMNGEPTNPWVLDHDNPTIQRVLARFSQCPRTDLWFVVIMRDARARSPSLMFLADGTIQVQDGLLEMENGNGDGGGGAATAASSSETNGTNGFHHDDQQPLSSATNSLPASKFPHTQVLVTQFPCHPVTRPQQSRRRRASSSPAMAAAAAAAAASSGTDDNPIASLTPRTLKKTWIEDTAVGPFDSKDLGDQVRAELIQGSRGLGKRIVKAVSVVQDHDVLMWRGGKVFFCAGPTMMSE